MIQINKIFFIVILCLFFCFFAETNCNKSLGQNEIILIPTEKEKSIGISIAKQVESKYEDVDDPLIQERFEKIGKKLARVCDRQDLTYHFKVLKAKEGKKRENFVNAFSLPGGYVYIFDVFIEVLETDEKIAAVTAHEIAHISARHAVKRLQGSIGLNALMALAIVAARDGAAVAEANEALNQLMLAYSRDDEFEADKLSIKYLKDAGFDPNGVLESLEGLRDLRKKGAIRRYIYYKTHPYLSERIAAARTEIQGYMDFDSYINLPETSDYAD